MRAINLLIRLACIALGGVMLTFLVGGDYWVGRGISVAMAAPSLLIGGLLGEALWRWYRPAIARLSGEPTASNQDR